MSGEEAKTYGLIDEVITCSPSNRKKVMKPRRTQRFKSQGLKPQGGFFMARQSKSDANLRCSFCGKSRDQVRKLIAGPTVYICDECVGLCNEIISEDWQESRQEIATKLCKPLDIHQHLDHYIIGQDHAKQVSFPLQYITTINGLPPMKVGMSNCKRGISSLWGQPEQERPFLRKPWRSI